MGKLQEAQDQYYLALTDEAIEKINSEGQDVEILYKSREAARQRNLEKMTNVVHLERLDEHKKHQEIKNQHLLKKVLKEIKNL